jgi:diguanylate cyclase (GGDEF)-like protein/PAS domain S-box-containing protein
MQRKRGSKGRHRQAASHGSSKTERNQIEKALLLAQTRLQHLVGVSPVVIYSCRASDDYGATYLSPNVTSQLGFEPREFTEDSSFWVNHVHPDDRPQVLAVLSRLFEQRHLVCEYRFQRKDGTFRWMHDELSLVKDARGNALEIVGCWMDITERKQAEEERRMLSQAVEQSPVSVVITDAKGDIEYVNSKFSQVTGYTFEEVAGKNPRILKSGDTPPEVYRKLWATITSGGEWKGEFHNKKKNGGFYWESASISPVRDMEGNITHFLAVKEDITDRKRAEQALAESEKRYRLLVDSSLGLICTHDLEGNLLSVNPAAAGALGYAPTELVGVNLCQLLVPSVRHIFPEYLKRVRQQRSDSGLMRVATKHGDELVWVYRNVLRAEAENEPYVLGHAQDITELKRLEEELRAQSVRDPLTGLFNRRYMEESMNRELHRAARKGDPLAIIMVDIDDFKQLNDARGHQAGDAVMRSLGNFLRTHIRPRDIACRYGGEEFALILPETTLEVGRVRAEQVREEVKGLDVQHGGQTLGHISVSLGVSAFPEHGRTMNAILQVADDALYRAKREGRDRVVVGDSTL